MDPNVYQTEAARTEADQAAAAKRLLGNRETLVTVVPPHTGMNDYPPLRGIRLLHGVIGVINELGEITSFIQKKFWYGKPISDEELAGKILDEAGDIQWHIMEMLSAYGVKFGAVLEKNIAKLRERYPNAGWSLEDSDNRDRVKEAEAVGCKVDRDDVAEELKKLRAFKAYVHKRLDDAGVPKEVPGKHLEEGCRIGGRLDWALDKVKEVMDPFKAGYVLKPGQHAECNGTGYHRYYPDLNGHPNFSDSAPCIGCRGSGKQAIADLRARSLELGVELNECPCGDDDLCEACKKLSEELSQIRVKLNMTK